MDELFIAKKLHQEIKSLLASVKRDKDTKFVRKVKVIQKLNQQLLKTLTEKKAEKK